MYFRDRTSAGIALGENLRDRKYKSPIIFALPRGGVPVAAKVADILGAPLETLVVLKLGAPFDPELAIGAIALEDVIVIDNDMLEKYDISDEDVQSILDSKRVELDRRIEIYGEWKAITIPENTAIIVDDGVATGKTMLAAVRYLRHYSPQKIIVATPVISKEAKELLTREGATVVCLIEDDYFISVGEYYSKFEQLTDEEVKGYIKS